uniref:Uncharacterized protein n=1 Tax=Dulem virus 42 TaxID=3145760 RepID=A0AAU8B7J3_9CAUD
MTIYGLNHQITVDYFSRVVENRFSYITYVVLSSFFDKISIIISTLFSLMRYLRYAVSKVSRIVEGYRVE